MNEIQKNAVGVPMDFELLDGDGAILNVASATLIELKFKSPITGTVTTKTATKVNGGTDGLVRYVTESGMFVEAGNWQMQARIVTPTPSDIPTQIVQFKVLDNL